MSYIRTPEHKEKMMLLKLGKKRGTFSQKWKDNMSKSHLGNKNHKWIDGRAWYQSIHLWIKRKLGKPTQCDNCGTKKSAKFEWANISGKYLKKVSDWQRLCASCHAKFHNRGKNFNV